MEGKTRKRTKRSQIAETGWGQTESTADQQGEFGEKGKPYVGVTGNSTNFMFLKNWDSKTHNSSKHGHKVM